MVNSLPYAKTISVGVGSGVLLGMGVDVGIEGGNGVFVPVSTTADKDSVGLLREPPPGLEPGKLQPAVNNSNNSRRKVFLLIFLIIQ